LECLDKYIKKTYLGYEDFIYDINGVKYAFVVWVADGKVTTDDPTAVVCTSGGEKCLSEYITTTFEIGGQDVSLSYDIKGVTYSFTMDSNGQSIDSNGNVVCATGGQECLD